MVPNFICEHGFCKGWAISAYFMVLRSKGGGAGRGVLADDVHLVVLSIMILWVPVFLAIYTDETITLFTITIFYELKN